jgi:hypothetical protein
MTAEHSSPSFAIVFAIAFAVLYVLAVEYNWALFTYHAALEEFAFLVEKQKDGPAMYWYGWLSTAGIGAFAIATVASWAPESLSKRIWPGWSWAVPLAAMFAFVYILRGFFTK